MRPRDAEGFKVHPPAKKPGDIACALKITGLKLR
jgi:hypothetical protein